MPERVIHQQPVTLAHVSTIVFVLTTGPNLDAQTQYRPVDETGTPIGETRAFTETFTGPDAQRVRAFLTAELLPDVNAKEGT